MYFRLQGLAQPSGSIPKPMIPNPPPVPMPNVLPEKEWCPRLRVIKDSTCVLYQPQEIAISRTASGHLTPDVVLVSPALSAPNIVVSCRYLIIRDFGVNWRHVKLAAKNEQLFKIWLNIFETDKSLAFRIIGYSDCVGIESNNVLLRKGRARNIFKLFGRSARSRVLEVIAAPSQTFLTDNSTTAARAANRSVVIEILHNVPIVI